MPITQTTTALMDAALSQQLSSVWGKQPHSASLEDRFPLLGNKHIEDALARATMLLASAFSAGYAALANINADIPAIIARLRERHPGFSDEGYRDVITFGCFLAR